MANRKGYLAVAFFLTVVDGFVAVHYGGLVWKAWSGDIWGRGLLVMFAALAITSLANVWAQAICRVSGAHETHSVNAIPVSIETRGARNV